MLSKVRKRMVILGGAWALLLVLVTGIACATLPTPSSSQSYAGTELQTPAPDFQLADQHGNIVALSDFQGKVVVLTFLDPNCTDVCPLTAQHFRQARDTLGSDADKVVFMAVNVNPKAGSMKDLTAATEKWGMSQLSNWRFLSGDEAQLQKIWKEYNIFAGSVKFDKSFEVEHSPGVYIIDRKGTERWYISVPLEATSWDGPSLSDLLVTRTRLVLAK
ncbi:MAG: alkyl hydroperoxide reductase/Thiol specific antioxidant/Mal allergen [Dehalococcoidia bacterium]|nr:alkyl hydroperoxide reductase/Thiol specific antioxidant/Mal allergen [Dehalococcoidia bacterium]